MNITKRSFDNTGLSMSILRVGDKSPVQTVFFAYIAGNLLPTLGFWGEMYHFCNFVINFLQSKSK